MNSSRLSLIANICKKRKTVSEEIKFAALSVSSDEVSQEAALLSNQNDKGDLPIDEDLPELPSSLPFVEVAEQHVDRSYMLTKEEKASVAKEVEAARFARYRKFGLVLSGFWGTGQSVTP